MSLPENLPIASFLAPMSSPPRCGECDRLRAALADRDREVAALRRRLDDAERRVIRERSHAEPKEGHRC